MRKSYVIAAIAILGVVALGLSAGACWAGFTMVRAVIPSTPTPVPPPIVSLELVRQAAELATVKQTLSTDIASTRVPEDIRQVFGVKEEIVLIAYGEVGAGFDLSTLDADDLWVDGTRVQLHLPAPQILYTCLDNERTHVVYYQKSWFIDHDLNLEGQARSQAEAAIRQAAMESDVLEQASTYGQVFFSNWLYSLGFTEVQVIVD